MEKLHPRRGTRLKTQNLIQALTLLAFLVLLSGLASAQAIAINRTIAPITQTNQEFQVTLTINAGSADPSGLIISETIPQQWTIVRADDSCVINQTKRLIKCVTYGENIANALHYTLKSPATNPPPKRGHYRRLENPLKQRNYYRRTAANRGSPSTRTARTRRQHAGRSNAPRRSRQHHALRNYCRDRHSHHCRRIRVVQNERESNGESELKSA